MITSRRSFLAGFGAVLFTPAVVKAEILMPVKTPFWTPPYVVLHTKIVRLQFEGENLELDLETKSISRRLWVDMDKEKQVQWIPI